MNAIISSRREIRTPAVTLDQVLSQLHALHVDVRTYQSAMSAECFDRCDWACDGELPAIFGVYPAEGVSHDVCLSCVIRCTEWAIEKSNGRSEWVTVELGAVAPPSPSVVLVPTQRQHDLAALLPVACDVCPEVRHSVAVFEIAFDVIRRGEVEGERWHVCPRCAPSCIEAALAQHAGFVPPVLSILPVTAREAVAA